MQDSKNSTSNRDYGDQNWKGKERHSQSNDWDREQSNVKGRNREERSGNKNDRRSSTDGRMGSYDEREDNSGYGQNSRNYEGMGSRVSSSSNRMGRNGNDREDMMGSQNSDYSSKRDNGYSGGNNFQQDDYGTVSNI